MKSSALQAGLGKLSLLLLCTAVGCEALWGGFAVWNDEYCGPDQCAGRDPDSGAVSALADMMTDGDQDAQDASESPQLVFAVGAQGTILRRTGAGWQREVAITTSDLMRVHGSDPRNVIAVGKRGTILDGNWCLRSFAPLFLQIGTFWG
jgi:hypothetical protein